MKVELLHRNELRQITDEVVAGSREYNIAKALLELSEKDPTKPKVCSACLRTFPESETHCDNKFNSMWVKK